MNTLLPGLRALTLTPTLAPMLALALCFPVLGSLPARAAPAQAAPTPTFRTPALSPAADRTAAGAARLSASALLERARQAAGLPQSGLTLLHERVQISESGERGGAPTYLSDVWTDLAGQRLKMTDYTGDTLDSVHLLTPAASLLYTPQHGTVPVPPQRAEILRWNLRSGVGGLGAASQRGVRLRAAGTQTWLEDGPQPLRGAVLEVTWPDGAAWQYLLDPQTGRLLADRSADKDLGLLTFTYSDPRAASAVKVLPGGAPQALEERTLLLPGGEVLYREQVLTRELNPALPPRTFELPQLPQASGRAQ
ncbi:hypothetical protein Deipr_2185 (plasmid) [Deinococcus proteolyticus MRP]|uniref:Outer membrane lipoprotein-sorting protein n=1 Tax=Deinococcus proteolyticus (strain ATCC 35074 / DSM 20540 / JCM 6276 / NBRC 101906 / NCIMB 13154 / VKM Ac-1939 / CCM 2703 / MRP) TaxID=693977 RepID=F0RPK8_DEIPM|nr:hypothetical protein [Deinococcus proteolyticus]ADY27314.1 hypothetical protein Deipr_2185 [Deinococcus proteolyticus MRP]